MKRSSLAFKHFFLPDDISINRIHTFLLEIAVIQERIRIGARFPWAPPDIAHIIYCSAINPDGRLKPSIDKYKNRKPFTPCKKRQNGRSFLNRKRGHFWLSMQLFNDNILLKIPAGKKTLAYSTAKAATNARPPYNHSILHRTIVERPKIRINNAHV